MVLNLRATLPIWSIRFYKSALSSLVTLFLLNLSEAVDLPCTRPSRSIHFGDVSGAIPRNEFEGHDLHWILSPEKD